MKFSELLEIAGMTEDDLPETEVETRVELDNSIMEVVDIRAQLANERAGITSRSVDDHTWPYRAAAAARHIQARVNALKRHLNRLKHDRLKADADARRAEKAARAKAQLEQDERATERRKLKAAAHNARMKSEAEAVLCAVRQHIKTLPDEDRDAFYAVIGQAQSEHRKLLPSSGG